MDGESMVRDKGTREDNARKEERECVNRNLLWESINENKNIKTNAGVS